MLGDVAQATGPVVYSTWAELGEHLPLELTVVELRHAYRVPAEIMDLALPLLERIAPDVEPPIAYRTGGHPPRFVAGGLEEALAEAAAFEDGLVAVIAAPSVAAAAPSGHVFEETEVPVLTAPQAKGLEFDHVVVVEPAAIVAEGGLRELYVALTRPTKTLVVVHEDPLPEEL
jgi:DNA helicase IV